MQYFNNSFALFFIFQQKQPSIQSRNHYATSSKITLLTVLWSHIDTRSYLLRQRTPSLKLPPSLGCWIIVNTGSEQWIRTCNNPKELSLDYMLGVASVQFSQVPVVYSVFKQSCIVLIWRACFLLINAWYFCCMVAYIHSKLVYFGWYACPEQTELMPHNPIWHRTSPCFWNAHVWWQVLEADSCLTTVNIIIAKNIHFSLPDIIILRKRRSHEFSRSSLQTLNNQQWLICHKTKPSNWKGGGPYGVVVTVLDCNIVVEVSRMWHKGNFYME